MLNTAIYLDLKSMPLSILGQDDESFIWPTPYHSYLSISKKITNNIVNLIYKNIPDNELRLGAISVLSVINIDLLRISKILIDKHYADLNNIKINMNLSSSPVSYHIYDDDIKQQDLPLKIQEYYPNNKKISSLKSRVLDLARWSKSGLDLRIKNCKGRIDFQNECTLLNEYMCTIDSEWVNMRPELWSWKSIKNSTDEVAILIDLIIDDFLKVITDLNIKQNILNKAEKIARIFLKERLTAAFNNANYINQLDLDKIAGDVLIGGTPQEIGRLLNWKYLEMGRNVLRFAHGGDRAFYDDIHWGLSEFPYCEKYYVHGRGEKDAVDSRLERNGLYYLNESRPEIVSLGSKKHQLIWKKSQKTKKSKKISAGNKIKVIMVAGSFLGERYMGTLDFKTPDPITADTQAWVVRTLEKLGYDVAIKIHPGGIDHSLRIQKNWGITILDGNFDNCLDTDVFIFDFAGTAFFDALATDKGIVLLDLNNRPFAKESFNDLNQRCKIVQAKTDQFNRIRFDPEYLKDAVESSINIEGCPEWFAKKYFWNDS